MKARHCPVQVAASEIAPEPTGHGLPLGKCEAYNRSCLDYFVGPRGVDETNTLGAVPLPSSAMRRTRSGCCPRAASGHVAVAPLSSVMNSRRFIIQTPRRRGPTRAAGQ